MKQLLTFICLFTVLQIQAQTELAVAFYNFENLFDTVDDPDTEDDDFTPSGANQYSEEVYQDKLSKLAQVVSELGVERSKHGALLLGVAEIENRKVLEDFTKQSAVANRNYGIVHYDCGYFRGVDVALLYNKDFFEVISSDTFQLNIAKEGDEAKYSRDILYVHGKLRGEDFHVFVNHWPSRRGGQAASMAKRQKAADIVRREINKILASNAQAKIVVMGDMNDDPISPSVTENLQANGKKEKLQAGELFNPWLKPYQKGVGSLSYRGGWNLFDQIIISQGLLNADKGLKYSDWEVFRKPYMVQPYGKYKGSAKRSYGGNQYLGGYSDHFPTIIYLR